MYRIKSGMKYEERGKKRGIEIADTRSKSPYEKLIAMSSTCPENMLENNSSTSVGGRRSRARCPTPSSSERVLHGTVLGGVSSSRSSSVLRNAHEKKRSGRPPSCGGRRVNSVQSKVPMECSTDSTASNAVDLDFSDDETQLVPSADGQKRSGHTRAHVLTYFTEQTDGFRCNLCHHVCSALL